MEYEDFEMESGNGSAVNLPKEAGLYWIHCNRCFEIYVHKRRQFFLLSCNHTICEKCAQMPFLNSQTRSNELKCPLCKKMQRFRVLSNEMPPNVKELFNPEPWREPSERTLNFQDKQLESFQRGMSHKLHELEETEEKCQLLEINCKKKYEKYEQLRIERKRLEQEVYKLKQQEKRSQNIQFQEAKKSAYDNGIFNENTFFGAKPKITGTRSKNGGGRNSQRTFFNNSNSSFSFTSI